MFAGQTGPKKVKNQKLQIFNFFYCIANVANNVTSILVIYHSVPTLKLFPTPNAVSEKWKSYTIVKYKKLDDFLVTPHK